MNTYYKSIPTILSRKFGTKFFLFLSFGFTLCLTSCDESSVVGLDVQPENDLLNVGYQDSTTILTRTLKGDSLITDESLITSGVALIGKYNDPVFGTSTASMYTQVRLPSNLTSTSFGSTPVCDSIILSLVYEGTAYGKKDRKNQKLNIYQLTESMSTSTVYHSNDNLTKSSIDLTAAGGFVFEPQPLDEVVVLGDTLTPRLRVPLDNTFGQLLLNNQGTGSLATNSDFQNFFKGMYLTTENTTGLLAEEGNILSFKMGESKITLYYRNSVSDSLSYDFSLGSVARFNHFEHDFAGTYPAAIDLTDQIGATGTAQNDIIYVQSMGGTKVKLEFPYLMNWVSAGAIGVNKAELVLKVDTSSITYNLDTFAAPAALILFGINDDGTTYAIPDAFEGSNYFGGTLGTLEYRFNIARYIQQVLDGDRSNNGLYLIASNGAIFGNRVILGGGSSASTRQMKLNITFTKLH